MKGYEEYCFSARLHLPLFRHGLGVVCTVRTPARSLAGVVGFCVGVLLLRSGAKQNDRAPAPRVSCGLLIRTCVVVVVPLPAHGCVILSLPFRVVWTSLLESEGEAPSIL